ncbi:major facilitator superfamily-domain-containing protein [Lentinula raphanica]|uniref:Major facilitator superfamily-domain-containing protein n=1 Tax=Lentinula raphanica TaxID=153919 RepID=A0AA38P4H4_9AGAR|nr:major facilitator superfamily-domain-containing protein [Lentinula raphanica]
MSSPKTPSIMSNVEPDVGFVALPKLSKTLLLVILSIAEFLDTFSNSALFSAIPPICEDLNISNSNSVWIQSGYQLTFAALLLMSGRLSDLYNPKWVFVAGGILLGLFSLGAGLVRSEIPLLLFRALMGVGAALTVPSALHIIVHMLPDPKAQSNAVAIFTASGGIGNIFGLLIGAVFVSFASWPWIFFFIAIMALVESALVLVLCHNVKRPKTSTFDHMKRLQRLDVVGVAFFTASLILFIFAVTSGSISGWGTAGVIAPLVISVALMLAFLFYETRIPTDIAVIPPKTWTYTNIIIMLSMATLPYMWWGSVQSLFSWYWQEVFGYSPITTAVHFLPIGLSAIPSAALADKLQTKVRVKWILAVGNVLATAGSIFLPFGSTRARFWPVIFPGLVIGSFGISMVFTTSNVAIFTNTPPEAAGVIAAMFNSALQLGCAAGIAITTSIQTSIGVENGDPNSFSGRADGFWFLVAVTALVGAVGLVLMKDVRQQAVKESDEVPMTVPEGFSIEKEVE